MRKTRYRGRWQSLSAERAGMRIAGRPSPMSSGAMAICRRSSRFAARNCETVTPPPSTKIRRQPRAQQRVDQVALTSTPASTSATAATVAFPKRALSLPRSGSPAHVQRVRGVVVEHAIVILEPPHRIEHDAQRARPGHEPRRQLRVVGRDGSRADDDRVAQRAHAVQVQDVLSAGHILRFARVRRDEAVEALSEMPDRDRRRVADGEIEIEQRMAWVVGRHGRRPSLVAAPEDDCSARVRADELRVVIVRECKGDRIARVHKLRRQSRGSPDRPPRSSRRALCLRHRLLHESSRRRLSFPIQVSLEGVRPCDDVSPRRAASVLPRHSRSRSRRSRRCTLNRHRPRPRRLPRRSRSCRSRPTRSPRTRTRITAKA